MKVKCKTSLVIAKEFTLSEVEGKQSRAPKLPIHYLAQFIIPNNAPPKTPQPSGPAMADGKARKILNPIASADKRAPPKIAPLLVSTTSDLPFGASAAIKRIIA